jgi:hypothetical protein
VQGSRQPCFSRAEQQNSKRLQLLLANRPPPATVWSCQSRHLLHNMALLCNTSCCNLVSSHASLHHDWALTGKSGGGPWLSSACSKLPSSSRRPGGPKPLPPPLPPLPPLPRPRPLAASVPAAADVGCCDQVLQHLAAVVTTEPNSSSTSCCSCCFCCFCCCEQQRKLPSTVATDATFLSKAADHR